MKSLQARRTRQDGYVDIGEYAVLGDGRTVALLASDGRIDWWPQPTLDAPPVLASVLDPERGGYFLLCPKGPFESKRRYLDGTNVLESIFIAEAGTARITGALNSGSAGRLPWTELALRVEGISGAVEMEWELVPGDRFGSVSPWVSLRDGTPFVMIGDQSIAVVVQGIPRATVTPAGTGGSFAIAGGERALIGLVATNRRPLFVPEGEAIDSRLDRSVESWRRWSALLDNSGEWSEQVERSALALKTLLTEATGAIAAAATTSLPEAIGGGKNWDYRYAWIRDSSFVLDAFINLGLHEEVHGAMTWLLDAIHRNGRDLAVFYTLSGELDEQCSELDVRGYRDSRPVRAGNGAARQTQLGTYGDLFDAICRYVREGHFLDDATQGLLLALAGQCCDQWRGVDSGIWELEHQEHYTISKIGCWVALDRAIQLEEAGQLPGGNPERWRYEAGELRAFIESRCWSGEKQSYTFYADTDELDAAVLLAGRTGYERGPRLCSTIDAVMNELGVGPYLYRYSGAQKEEGAFVACTYWMVEALAYGGRLDEARRLMNDARVLANDVGILAEQADPLSARALGNVPQALSHLALINAVHTIRRAEKGMPDRGAQNKPSEATR
ncbi:MAG TPA: glycoside hydrolase family 15 protein [Acidimicrobiales bacterium]|nr:glycoside hydrolase family 15 protein [Acidimicrobiales bacterium]